MMRIEEWIFLLANNFGNIFFSFWSAQNYINFRVGDAVACEVVVKFVVHL